MAKPDDTQGKPTSPASPETQFNPREWARTAAPQKATSSEPKPTPLEEWAKSIINDGETQIDPDPTETLSRFGLKNAAEVLQFLRSTEGKKVLSELNLQADLDAASKRNSQIKAQEDAILMHRLRSSLFLWVLKKEAHATEQQREIVLEQNKVAIKVAGTTVQSSAITAPELQRREVLRHAIADYKTALVENDKQLSTIRLEGKFLVAQIDKLKKQEKTIIGKYKLLHKKITKDDNFLEVISNSGDKPEIMLSKIQRKMTVIEAKMTKELEKIADLVDDVAITKGIKKVTELTARLGSNRDYVAVCLRKKYYADENGEEITKLSDYKKAHFVLDISTTPDPNEPAKFLKSKIVKDEHGKYYLLKPGQNWNTIKDNPGLKAQSQKDFEIQKPHLLVVKHVITRNETLELGDNRKIGKEVHNKFTVNKAAETLHQNQAVLLKAGLANTEARLKQPGLGYGAPVPTPTVTASPAATPTPKPQISAEAAIKATLLYKGKLQALQDGRNQISPTSLLDLANSLPSPHNVTAYRNLQAEFGRWNIAHAPSRAPIPPLTMNLLLQNLARFGADPNKPYVTAIPSQSPLKAALVAEKADPDKKPDSHSPFNTSLTPKP